MNGADLRNQRKKYLSIFRIHNIRFWKPLFHFLLHISVTNTFILWQERAFQKNRKAKWDPYNLVKYIADRFLLSGATSARKVLGAFLIQQLPNSEASLS
jgi:hypothetical protein